MRADECHLLAQELGPILKANVRHIGFANICRHGITLSTAVDKLHICQRPYRCHGLPPSSSGAQANMT